MPTISIAMATVVLLTAATACGRGQRATETASGDGRRRDAADTVVRPDATPDGAVEDITAGMVRIPGGPLYLWCDKAQEPACLEPDPRPTTVGEFFIDRTEVTVAAYRRCVDEGACTPTTDGPECPAAQRNWDESRDDHPVNCVTSPQAETYCRSRGKHLPTETQWVAAARGAGELIPYPWGGDRPSCRRAVIAADAAGSRCGASGTQAVGTHPDGASHHGAHDLVGNVAEFTISDGLNVEAVLTGGFSLSARGGSYASAADDLALRLWSSRPDGIIPQATKGFRCAYTVPGSDEWKRIRRGSR